MIAKILVAYDGSEPAEHAFEVGVELAERLAARLRVVAVVRPPDPASEAELAAVLESGTERYRELLAPLEEMAKRRGISCRFEVVAGHPVERICTLAEEGGDDLIVVGHRSKGFFARLLVGSVSKQVVSHAPCSVLVVR